MSKRARNTKGQASSSREETMEEKVRKFGLFDYEDHQMNYDNLSRLSIHPGDVVDWEFLSNKGNPEMLQHLVVLRKGGEKVNFYYVTHVFCAVLEGVACNIPYWLAKYLKGLRDKSMIFEGMFVTKIARSFGLLTEEIVSVLNRKPPPHVYRNNLLVKIGVIMKLHEGEYWLGQLPEGLTKEVGEGGGGSEGDDEEAMEKGGNEELGGSLDITKT
ncbi:hypothetical protein Tco_0319640 [Tanacetum coccineum]